MSGLNNNSRRSSLAIDGQQSLLNAIKNFVQAVDSMDETVMIPCRLRDIPVESVSPAVPENRHDKATSIQSRARQGFCPGHSNCVSQFHRVFCPDSHTTRLGFQSELNLAAQWAVWLAGRRAGQALHT
ncbi:hypothetical protein RRG08_049906 [Elysia crispata]|uniref:Uncharacterized protein n=1 Tax=Elysia crispata TaxID=231223 RepID=A0AAE0XZR3_9GAST|nr:hypothetical protein RRG08_049906 [Elysia crispata]